MVFDGYPKRKTGSPVPLFQFFKSIGRIKARAGSLVQGASHSTGFSENTLLALRDLEPPIARRSTNPRGTLDFGPPQSRPLSQTNGSGRCELIGLGCSNEDHFLEQQGKLVNRLAENGHKSLQEYELLELLLCNTVAPVDSRILAKRLLAEFGDLHGITAASRCRVRKVDGATDRVFIQLQVVQAIAHRIGQSRLRKRNLMTSWDVVLDYCRLVLAHCEVEHFRVLFLDQNNELIADEEQAKGTIDHVPVYPREVAKRALEVNATGIILVHNHPSGDPTPSSQDREMTERLTAACEAIGVTVHDHLIIGKATEFSFNQNGAQNS